MARIDLAYPGATVPFDGIGDHTARLARALRERGHEVRVLGRGGSTADGYVDAWGARPVRRLDGLVEAVAAAPPQLLVLQLEHFAYGARGFSPGLLTLARRIRRAAPDAGLVVFAHETYVPPAGLRHTVMWSYQRAQLAALARGADHVLTNNAVGLARIGALTEALTLVPVPSNLPRASATRAQARAALGLETDALLAVVFGHLDPGRVAYLESALAAARAEAPLELLYVGKDEDAARGLATHAGVPAHLRIGLPPEHAALALRAGDLALSPFSDGASGRRGSLAACLDHGLATVTNTGEGTDAFLHAAAQAGALRLTDPDPAAYADAAVALAVDASERAAMERVLATGDVPLASWEATAEAVEAHLPRTVAA
ncbi:glycosyltransferase family 4 protein [Demequina gelatinilytica]|uniref:glycosyltransferase family 4 protein n=1 Tax=Demequina gelatinilytica TaxID=1638980 RepID=UPI00078354E0|nr:glycosyltransferase family 4 protein [Demequina gelatinilytica]